MAAIFLTIQLAILAASLVLWGLRFGKMQRDGAMLAQRPSEVSPVGMADIGVTVAIWFTLQILGFLPVMLFMDLELAQLNDVESLTPEQILEFSGWLMLMQLAATFVAAIWFVIRHGWVEWLGTGQGLARDVLVGLAGSLMLLPIVMLVQLVVTQLIPYSHPTLDSLAENFSGKTAIWAWVSAVGVAPLAEEFFFRGVIQGWLQRVMDHDEPIEKWFIGGKLEPKPGAELANKPPILEVYRFWAPIVITSIVFAGVHLGQGPAPIPLFLLSLGLGYIFRKTGSFVPCAIIHLILNSLSMIILTLNLVYPELAPAEPETVSALFLR